MKRTLLVALLAACAVGDEGDDDFEIIDEEEVIDTGTAALRVAFAGVNGTHCIASPYNCRFREGDARVTTAGGEDSWAIEPGASVRDGNGTALVIETRTRMTFNYGQTRLLAGKAHALAVSTSNSSSSWYPIDRIKGETSFRARMGEVNAKDPRAGRMGCYQIRNGHDESIELRKVVFDSQVGENGHERAGDYQSLVRANGKRSANLVFSVPGFALGGATTDHFPAGTKFRRVDVPTSSGRPSITIPLWVKDSAGRYRKRAGAMRFLYGYIRAADGVKRFGWMAEAALRVSSGC